MTKKAFESFYAKTSGLSKEKLKQIGLMAIPCDCGQKYCQGWKMVNQEMINEEDRLHYVENFTDTSDFLRDPFFLDKISKSD